MHCTRTVLDSHTLIVLQMNRYNTSWFVGYGLTAFWERK